MTIFISDQAEEFRIGISGRFCNAPVRQAARAWQAALAVNMPRRISVDITEMTGYDRAGLALLREIYLHGTHIAAGTPRSLRFLNEISLTPAARAEMAASKRDSVGHFLSLQTNAAFSGK